MRELPILFPAEMIQAIHAGRKTVTRWVMKPQPPESLINKITRWENQPRGWFGFQGDKELWPYRGFGQTQDPVVKPKYQVCDLLWVKEGWRCTGGGSERNIIYKADGDTAMSFCGIDDGRESILHVPEDYWAEWDRLVYKTRKSCEWRSPLFMPKWAVRTWLEVISVRPERLQDITEEDCIREGIELDDNDIIAAHAKGKLPALYAFIKLWDSINAKRGYSWDSNPWVWRIEFKESTNG